MPAAMDIVDEVHNSVENTHELHGTNMIDSKKDTHECVPDGCEDHDKGTMDAECAPVEPKCVAAKEFQDVVSQRLDALLKDFASLIDGLAHSSLAPSKRITSMSRSTNWRRNSNGSIIDQVDRMQGCCRDER